MDPIALAFVGTFAALLIADALWPARDFPRIRLWRLGGLLMTAVSLAVATVTPLLIDDWLYARQLVDLSGLGVVGGTLVALALFELLNYWWHRALHRFSFLWRFHQMHHSSERIDIYSGPWTHPLDTAGFALMGSLALVLLVGVQVEAAVAASIVVNVLALFQHANLRTPQWLGWLIQRPENHSMHHQRGVHADNYGSISLWDQVFGTFYNPRVWAGQAGFYDGASRRVPELLAGLDVTEPETPSQVDLALDSVRKLSY